MACVELRGLVLRLQRRRGCAVLPRQARPSCPRGVTNPAVISRALTHADSHRSREEIKTETAAMGRKLMLLMLLLVAVLWLSFIVMV